MSAYSQEFAGSRFALRLGLFYAALFTTIGVQLPFLPVWLAAKGLDARAIGIVLALPMIVRVLAIPLATRVADRRDALRAVIVATAAVAVAGYALVGLADGFVPIMVTFALASAAYAPVILLVDAYAMRGLLQRGRAYGPVRLWGSAAFIAASFGAGFLLDVIAAADLIWLIVAAIALSAAAACALEPLEPGGMATATTQPRALALLRDPPFALLVAAASLVQASHAVYYGFATLDWQRAGFDGTTIGALWALGVLAEIALFAVSAQLPASVTPIVLMQAGAIGAVVRWSLMALDPPAALLPALQCLHAFSFGATHLGALGFVARATPTGLGATAQGYLGIALGLTMAAAMSLSGVFYGRYANLAYGGMALAAAAGTCCALAASRMSKGRPQ